MNQEQATLFMQKALEEAKKARLISPPNPWVGALLVKDGKIIGIGHTQEPGNEHAEVQALKSCTEETKDSICFVTLEPCSHYGRTPPCVKALIEAKISKCYIAMLDPDPNVSGKGVQALKQAGVEVEVGLLENKAKEILKPYIVHRTENRPYIILKYAQSIDGHIAASDFTSQWISCPEARDQVQKDRRESQSILIGGNTARTDNPSLTLRMEPKPSYQINRVIISNSFNLPNNLKLLTDPIQPTLVYSSSHPPYELAKHVEHIELPSLSHTLLPIFQSLAEKGSLQVYVEGGSSIISQCLEQKLFDRIDIYTGPLMIGSTGVAAIQNPLCSTLSQALPLSLIQSKVYGQTTLSQYKKRCD